MIEFYNIPIFQYDYEANILKFWKMQFFKIIVKYLGTKYNKLIYYIFSLNREKYI